MTRSFTRSEDAGLVLVSGEAGVGKSRLAAAAADLAADAGVLVFGGWCLQLSQDMPLLPLLDVLRRMFDVDDGRVFKAALGDCPAFVEDELLKLLPELGDGRSVEAADGGAYRHRLFEAVRRLLSSFARIQRVAVVIEDLHWADRTTVELLGYLAGPGHRSGLPMVLTYRSGEPVGAEFSDWLDRMRRDLTVQHVALAPLSREETAEQIGLLLDEPATPEFADAIFARSEGNAFFTEQLVSYWAGGDGSGLPPGLASLVLSRAAQVDASARAVLVALTVAGRGLDEETLAAVCERPAPDLRHALRELIELRLLQATGPQGDYRLRHALLAEALGETILPGEARELHARLGHVLSTWADRSLAGEVADHFEAAGVVDREFALRCVAARYAEDAAAPRDAAGQWQRVITLRDLVPHPESVADLDLVGVYDRAERALFSAGQRTAAGALAKQALARLADDVNDEQALALYAALGQYGPPHTDERFAAAVRAVEIGARLPSSRTYLRALSLVAGQFADQGRFFERDETWRVALTAATRAGLVAEEKHFRANALWLDYLDDNAGGVLRGIDAVLAIHPQPLNPLDEVEVLIVVTDMLLRFAQHDRIVELALPAIERAEATGHGEAMFVHVLRSNAAEALLESGDLARAAILLDPLAESPPTRDSCLPYMELAQLNVYRGRLDDAARFWTDAADLFGPGPSYDFAYNVARRRLELHFWNGDPLAYVPDALDLFEVPAAQGDLMLWGDAFVGVLRALAEAAHDARLTRDPAGQDEVAHMYRRLDAAKHAADRDLFDATQCGLRVAPNGATWRAELTRYEGASDPDAWALAATAWADIGCPFAAGYARWRQAEALLADRGRRAEAIPALRTASAEATGHVPLSSAISALGRRARIDLSPAPDPKQPVAESRPFGLTDREYEVLKLVGQGLTNAEIGRTLFISAKTVSVHVTSIMRKLGVSTRVQASTIAARTGILE